MYSRKMKNQSIKFFICTIPFIIQICTAAVSYPLIWERSIFTINGNAIRNIDSTTSVIKNSQDIQTVLWPGNSRSTDNLVFNFGEACSSSNTTIQELQTWNSNLLRSTGGSGFNKLALVKRGKCNWSEKITVIDQLASRANITISSVFVYDNNTYGENVYIEETPVKGRGSASPKQYANELPLERSVTSMTDNDLSANESSLTVVFIPNSYGELLTQRTGSMYSQANQRTDYWVVNMYLEEVSWDDLGGSPFTRGYIAYIIAVAAAFVIGFLILRWWRIRRIRAYANQEYIPPSMFRMRPMQNRSNNNRVDPLPVDIVNRLPIAVYTDDLIKNTNCAICLEDYIVNKSDLRILPCGHGFCVLCIDPWLTQKSTMCPICKWDCLPIEMRRERDLARELERQQREQANNLQSNNQPNSTSPPSFQTVQEPEVNQETILPVYTVSSTAAPITTPDVKVLLSPSDRVSSPEESSNRISETPINESNLNEPSSSNSVSPEQRDSANKKN